MSSLLRMSAPDLLITGERLSVMLSEQLSHATGRRPAAGELRSWNRSARALATDLVEAELPHVEVLLEYQLPYSSKRADAVLAGISRATGRPKFVVVELKQWTAASRYVDDASLVTIPSYGPTRPVSHPIDQVRGYVDYLRDYTAVLAEDPQAIEGVAYLHNASDLGIADLLEMPGDDRGRMFTGQHRGEFVDYLKRTFADESGLDAADRLLSSRIAPSKQLLALAADEVQRREQFVLLDEQRDAYRTVLSAVDRARRADVKTAVIVTGGPGSGKSVIALSLLGELARQGRTVLHATGSRSFTTTLRKVAGKGSTRVQSAFKYFNSFMTAEANDLDCLILDEAHRIRETSANRWTRAEHRTGRRQIDELLSAARVPVFLLDEHQVVRPGELGTVEEIERSARERGMEIARIDLDAQFRCGGSEAYVKWVLRLLGLEPGGPIPWEGDGRFELATAESPAAMEAGLKRRLEDGYSARMAAGYCWPWSDPLADGSLVPDVRVGDWARPWNLKSDRAVGGAPPSSLWATDPAGFGQVGCVYTAQGFEYDHSGVIFGPDLVWRGGGWVARRGENRDPDFKNRTKVPDEEFAKLVTNVYKVLLTRGLASTTIYSTDPETQAFLEALVPGDESSP